jgi:hypothetical protein
MARKFLIPLQAEIDALIITNNTGAITANILRPLLKDVLESSAGLSGWLSLQTPVPSFIIEDVWTEIPMETEEGGDNSFLITNVLTNSIATSGTPGWIYVTGGELCVSGQPNRVIEVGIAVNGAPMGVIGALTLVGPGKPVTGLGGFYQEASSSNEDFTLIARCVSHPTADVRIQSAALKASLNPTPGP